MEASPVQHIQDVYGSPSREEQDLTQHRDKEKVPFMAPPQRSVRVDRGYSDSMNVRSRTFIPCRDRFYPSRQDNLAYISAGNGLGYRRGFSRAGYIVENPLSDLNVVFEGQGPGGHNRKFVVQGQSPS